MLSSWSSNQDMKRHIDGSVGGGDDDDAVEVDAAMMEEMAEGENMNVIFLWIIT